MRMDFRVNNRIFEKNNGTCSGKKKRISSEGKLQIAFEIFFRFVRFWKLRPVCTIPRNKMRIPAAIVSLVLFRKRG